MAVRHVVDGVVIAPTMTCLGRFVFFLKSPFVAAWHHRALISTILRRELRERFVGSVAGWIWAIFAPLSSLTVYTLIFKGAAILPNQMSATSDFDYALFIFGGLIAFNFFSEMAYRAPVLLHEYTHFIKHTMFPIEMLPLISTLRAGVYASIGLALMLLAQIVLAGTLHWTILLLPFWALALLAFLIGLTWLLSSLGAFTRDIAYFMAAIVPILMFATPIFYSQTDLPAPMDRLIYLNLMIVYVDIVRDLVVFGTLPSWFLCLWTACVSGSLFWGGYWVFRRNRFAVVDIL